MKRLLALFIGLLGWQIGFAQTLPDTTISLDVLQVPATVAFSLLGVEPNVVDEPKNPADFAVALNNATDSFTVLPRNYGIEFAPVWVFGRDKIDFTKYISNSVGRNLAQGFTVSLGVNTIDNPVQMPGNLSTTQLAFGLKTSLWRGTIDSKYESIDSMYHVLENIETRYYKYTNEYISSDPIYKMWNDSLHRVQNDTTKIAIGERIKQRFATLNGDKSGLEAFVEKKLAGQLDSLKARAANLKFTRHGFKLDVAGGLVTDFFDHTFDNSKITRVGLWATGGWAFRPTKNNLNFSLLGVTRLLGNPDQLYRRTSDSLLATDNNLFLDYGARFILQNGDRLSLSGELVGRQPINNANLKATARYSFNIEYQLAPRMLLTFSIGKNFNGVISKGGNLITALHLFASFGKRKFGNSGQAAK